MKHEKETDKMILFCVAGLLINLLMALIMHGTAYMWYHLALCLIFLLMLRFVWVILPYINKSVFFDESEPEEEL